MLLSKILFLCSVAGTVFGYGYGYRSNGSSEEKTECKKLMHYDVTPPTNAQLNRKAKFTHLTKNGMDYVMISCPSDSFKYALISENSGSVFDISGSEYPNSVVLAAGFKVGFIAKCHGKKITAETTDGTKICLDKVACIRYSSFLEPETEITEPACAGCQIDELAAQMNSEEGLNIRFTQFPGPDGCKGTQVTCEALGTPDCVIKLGFMSNGTPYFTNAANGETSLSINFICAEDGLYSYDGEINGISDFKCEFTCLG